MIGIRERCTGSRQRGERGMRHVSCDGVGLSRHDPRSENGVRGMRHKAEQQTNPNANRILHILNLVTTPSCMQGGAAALHKAARSDNPKTVELLLQHKASVNIQARVIRGGVGARSFSGG